MKKIAFTAIAVIALGGMLFIMFLSSDSEEASGPEEASVPSPTPTTSFTPSLHAHEDHDDGTVELSHKFPLVPRLPYENAYWKLSVGGEIENGILPVDVTVYVPSPREAEATISKQKPYIVQWISSVGQTPHTYKLNIDTYQADVY